MSGREEFERLARLASSGDVVAAGSGKMLARRRGDWAMFAELAKLSTQDPDRVWHNAVDGSELIWIPAGPYFSGEGCVQRVVEAFALARHPVTNAQWLRFVEATGYEPDVSHPEPERYLSHWVAGRPPQGLERHPVVQISWLDAMHYCAWAGLTLPSEAMWEKAARGVDQRPYPWGSTEPSAQLCRIQSPTTVPVGSYPRTRTAWGCQDMIGNVSEWCHVDMREADGLSPAAGSTPLTLATRPELAVLAPVRGSAYMRSTTRRMTLTHTRRLRTSRRNHWVGFRPALLVPEVTSTPAPEPKA